MNSKWMIYLLIVVLFTACYKTEEVIGEPEAPKYKLEDSSDPVDHYIYEFYQKYNSFIFYRYSPIEYEWNMSGILPVTLVAQTDRAALDEGLQFMEKVFFKYYDEEFKKHHFPFKILMADSVQVERSLKIYPNESATAGIAYMGIGNIRKGISQISPDLRNDLKGDIHAVYWANSMLDNDRLRLTEAYWNISGEFYGINLASLEENEKVPAEEIDVRKYGFWEKASPEMNPKRYCMAPKPTLDIFQFIKMITTHTKQEMEKLVAPYGRLKDKYYLLTDHLEREYGVDIQAIGNDK